MYARVVTFRGQPNKVKDGARKLEESIPTLRGMSGFKDIYFLTDHKTGNCMVFALWESEQELQNAWDAIVPMQQEMTRALGSTEQAKTEVYEVSLSPGQMRRAA